MIMKVRLKQQHARYAKSHDLTPGNTYRVIGIEADDYRLLDDAGRPYLHGARWFEVIDPTEPADWQTRYGDDGERYSYPAVLNRVGFFEDYFDDVSAAILAFNTYLEGRSRITLADKPPPRRPRKAAERDSAAA